MRGDRMYITKEMILRKAVREINREFPIFEEEKVLE